MFGLPIEIVRVMVVTGGGSQVYGRLEQAQSMAVPGKKREELKGRVTE